MANYYLYTTAKRHNSTLVPSGGIQAALVLKAGTSLLRPTFLLEIAQRPTATMVSFEGRYYFVTDIRSIRNNLWELECEVDPLSTYKTDILATSAFVLYDTTSNSELVDSRLSIKTTKSVSISTATSSFFETGCVLVGIVGTDNTGVFAMTPSQASSLLSRIATHWLDDADMLPVPDVTDFSNWDDAIGVFVHNFTVGFRQLLATGKAPDSIKSAIYVPVPASAFQGSTEDVWLGDYDTGISAKLLSTAGHADEVTSVSIPWGFTDWRRNNPYTQIYIKLPYVGVINIPPGRVMGASSITVEVHVSQSGSVAYNLQTESTYLGRYSGNCSSNFMIGASNINPLNSAMAAGSVGGAGIAAALATGPTGLAAAGTAAIVGVVNGLTEMPTSIGGTGGGAYSDSAVIQCYVISHDTNISPGNVSPVMGTPTMLTKSLAGLGGYVETRNFSVSGSMTDTERDMINRLMDGGVYIE